MSTSKQRIRPLWQKWAFIGVLLGAILALNGVYSAVAEWQPILTAPPGQVIYAAGFDGFTEEWQQYSGRLSSTVADGKLVLQADELNSAPYSLANPQFGDFDLTVQAQAVGGPEDNGFGVIFRLQDSTNTCDMPLKILCDLSEIDALGVLLRLAFRPQDTRATGYYYFMVSSDGYYALFKAEKKLAGTQANRVSTWIASDAIQVGIGATNTLRVVAQRNTFQFYINGTPVKLCIADDPTAQSTYDYINQQCIGGKLLDVYTDNSYQSGQIGFIIQTPQNATELPEPVAVEFDNLIITSPKTQAVQA